MIQNKPIRHLDLFSGIGGFALAVESVWGGVEHIFCDNDLFCQQVLKKHWPNSKIYGDIRTITNTENERLEGEYSKGKIQTKGRSAECFILTGGFPCQPFSQAGRRKGTMDDRHLWPEMLRVIRLAKPQWVIAENVRGLLTISEGLVFEQVCADLEASGYEVQPFIIPAVAVNAPHRRDRVWFVAHRTDEYEKRGKRVGSALGEPQAQAGNRNSYAQDALGIRGRGGLENNGQILESGRSKVKNEGPSWEENWLEVAACLCGMDDGLPAGLDGFKLTKSRHRAERLKSLGNAIVPQVAIEIMKAIKLTQIQ